MEALLTVLASFMFGYVVMKPESFGRWLARVYIGYRLCLMELGHHA